MWWLAIFCSNDHELVRKREFDHPGRHLSRATRTPHNLHHFFFGLPRDKSMSRINLTDAPDDIILHIAWYLSVADILALRQVCLLLMCGRVHEFKKRRLATGFAEPRG